MKINGFPGYTYKNGILYNSKNKEVKQLIHKKRSPTYRVKNYLKKWTHLSLVKLKALTGEIYKLPHDAKKITGFNKYYIDPRGIIYSFSSVTPNGRIMKQSIGSNGYLSVTLGSGNTKEIHAIIANTFIMEGYAKKGLCVLHRDNNKLNCNLNNLCIGTYSRNNKQSYEDKLNPGNGLKAM